MFCILSSCDHVRFSGICNIKIPSHQYRESDFGDKTVSGFSNLQNAFSIPLKSLDLYIKISQRFHEIRVSINHHSNIVREIVRSTFRSSSGLRANFRNAANVQRRLNQNTVCQVIAVKLSYCVWPMAVTRRGQIGSKHKSSSVLIG